MHAHGGHSHSHDERRLWAVLALILALMIGEVVAGLLANSLALLSDAAHMLTDAAALVLSLVALRLATRPAAGNLTFGLKRAEILSAQANGVTLLVLALLIVYGGIEHLISPPDVNGTVMAAVAGVGLIVNALATRLLHGAERRSLNVEGAFQHVLTDALAFALTLVAGLVIVFTGRDRADGVAALAIASIMLRSAWMLLRASGRVFLEAAPEGTSVAAIGSALAEHPGVVDVHDLHVWEITSGFPALSAHVLVRRGDDCHARRRELEQLLEDEFGITHTTLQVDHAPARAQAVEMGHVSRRRSPLHRR
jgi:cobalt-zinc-cadmium efflux system protein